jgi:energy-coupling factor transport system ATP-binding protein
MPSASLQTRDLTFSYLPGSPVLRGINLEIEAGTFTAVIGQNGSGKTTLMKHFNGLLRPQSGQVLVNGEDISRQPVSELARCVGYVFQNPDHQIFSASTREEIAFGLRNLELPEDEIEARIEQTLVEFRLLPFAERQPAVLSFGLRRKVSLAAVFAMQPSLLIFDEPTSGLDWKSTQELIDLLHVRNRQGTTILFITHDLRLVADAIPRCLALSNGQITAHGATREVLANPATNGALKNGLPPVHQLAAGLKDQGFPTNVFTVDDFTAAYHTAAAGSKPGGAA